MLPVNIVKSALGMRKMGYCTYVSICLPLLAVLVFVYTLAILC